MSIAWKTMLLLIGWFSIAAPAQAQKPLPPAEAMRAHETDAEALLRTINAACVTYAATYQTGFPAALNNLGPASSPNAKAAGLIDAAAASGKKHGYSFVYTAGQPTGGMIVAYKIQADPLEPGKTGQRHFFTDQSGVLRANSSAPATMVDDPVGPKDSHAGGPGATGAPAPAANPTGAGRITVSADVQAAKRVSQVSPVYPPLARQARISGTVRLHMIVSPEGVPQQLEVVSGSPLLIRAAIDAVRQWRYQPTLLNGQPVEVETVVDVVFSLAEPPKPSTPPDTSSKPQ